MTMRYFENPHDDNKVYGYDEAVPTDVPHIEGVVAAGWVEVTGKWPPGPSVEETQAVQGAKVATACKDAIDAGFTSSALGDAYQYGGKITDQSNIALAALNGGNLWCADSKGEWEHRAHTASQARQVQKDMAAFIQAEQSHYAELLAKIKAATTVAEVEAVTWVNAADRPNDPQPASGGLFNWGKRG